MSSSNIHTLTHPFCKALQSKGKTHKALTLDLIKRHTIFLHENLADMLNDHCTKHLTYHQFIWRKKNQNKIIHKDQDIIPKSSRVNFKFHVSQEAEQSE